MSVDPKAILERIESIYGPLAEGVPSVAYVYEPGVNGRCLYISPSIERVLGYSQEEWIMDGSLWDRLLHPEDADRVISAEAECARSGEALVQEYRISRSDGRVIWIRDEMTVVRGADRQADPLFFGVFLDVTERKRMEAELERLALYDSLTGLPNRALFNDRLDQAIARRCALAGDRRATSSTWIASSGSTTASATPPATRCCARWPRASSGCCAPSDTVARFGGDEFTVLCESVGGVLEAVGVADRLQREIAQPLRARGAELRLSASVGIALAEPGDEATARASSRTPTPRCTARRSAAARARAVRRGHARARGERALDRAGAPARARARRAAALLPAAREPRQRRDGRRRGADPLGAPRARAALPGRLPAGGRGERA